MLPLYKMNEIENYSEQDAQTKRLLEAICEGVEVPTDEEAEEVFHQQH